MVLTVSEKIPNISSKEQTVVTLVLRAVALLVMQLGFVVLIGWLSRSLVLLTLVEGLPVMSFNTALGFLLLGGALWCAQGERYASRVLVTVFSYVTLLIASIRLLQHLSILPGDIDGLFVGLVAPADFLATANGGMGPNTCLCFIFISISLLIKNCRREERVILLWSQLLPFFVTVLGVIAVAGYLSNSDIGYAWDRTAKMALHTSIGVIMLGSALLFEVFRKQALEYQGRIPFWVPLMLCFIAVMVDLYTLVGSIAGILYIPLILCALWLPGYYTAFYFAASCSVLALLSFTLAGKLELEDFFNRLMTILTLLTMAFLVYYFRKANGYYLGERIRFEALISSTPDAVITIDEKGAILSFNPAAERMFAYDHSEVMGKNLKMLMPEPYHSEHDGYLRRYRRTDEKRIIGTNREVTAKRKDGSIFPIDLSISTVANGDTRSFVGIIRDRSDKQQAEEERSRYTAELERSNRELDDFAYIASHDLKEPLRGLHNHSRFLLEDNEGKLDEDSEKRLHRLVFLSQRMERLVNDLLYFSRLGRQDMAIQETDLKQVIEDIEYPKTR